MESREIRTRFLKFFEKRGHAIIPSASLVPENDPSVLFNTAGMQPLVPYLLGQTHPMGKRIVDVQKCVRTGDLDDIGDNRHFSFFEMLGNWSLGDYFKQEAIQWSYEFLTSKEEGLGLDKERLYVTIFEGDENAPFDQESKDIWMSLGVPEHRIYALPADDNWWSPGDNGPCGPCSEMFYDMIGVVGDLTKEEFISAQKREDVIEIWNDVFMEFEKKDGKVIGKLSQKNVDTGAGLERMTAVMQGKMTAYDTDLFKEIFSKMEEIFPGCKLDLPLSEVGDFLNEKIRARRIIADHIRTAVIMIADGVVPGNKGRDYILRRLIRRALVWGRGFSTDLNRLRMAELSSVVIEKYSAFYSDLKLKEGLVFDVLVQECSDFNKTLTNGIKEFDLLNKRRFFGINGAEGEEMKMILGEDAFDLWQTYGFPIELTAELAKERGMSIDIHTFEIKKEEHQEKSRTASAGMFKGGLANHNDKTIKLHTAHHLLLAALQHIVSKDIKQRGSNITEERLRIDFLCDHKLTDEEKQKTESWVNEKIKEGLTVVRRELPREEAMKIGAEMEFGAKYPDMVSVYFIEDKEGNPISKEFCGGPHVTNTSELGVFKMQKEEAVAQGIRRIKAVLL